MGKAKSQQMPFEQNTQYGEWRPSETEDLKALRAVPNMPESLAPSLQAQFDRGQEASRQRWNSAYGQNIPEVTRRAMQGQEQRGMTADYGSAMGQAAFDANQANYARKLALAEMTLGRPIQTKSYGYQTQFAPSSGIWNSLIQAGGTVLGGMAMTGGI